MTETTTTIGAGGRVVLPSSMRKELGVSIGDEVVLVLDEDGLRLLTREQAVRRAQKLVALHVPRTRKLAREMIRERREEARRG